MVLAASDTGQAVLYFSLSALVIGANLLVVIAVRYMKSAKKATIVFLSQLAVCNLVQGLVFFLKALFYIWPVQVDDGCRALIMFSVGSSGAYVTGILYLYLDLYLALKRRSVLRPVISSRTALLMVALAWVVWLGIAALGYLLKNPNWGYDLKSECSFSSGAYDTKYAIGVCVLFLLMFVVIMICHIGTLRVMRQAYRTMALNHRRNTITTEQARRRDSQSSAPASAKPNAPSIIAFEVPCSGVITCDRQRPISASRDSQRRPRRMSTRSSIPTVQERTQSKWLKKNLSMVRIVVIVMCIFSICWYPSIIIILILAICDNCLPGAVTYLFNILIILQYISNGFIYLAKSREFQEAFKRLFSCCCKKRIDPAIGDGAQLGEPTRTGAV